MNLKATKACRAFLLEARGKSAIPREAKRGFAALASRERGALRRQWAEAQDLRRLRGKNKQALVEPSELRL